MDSVGVREIRQNLSVYLARIKAGERLTITEHGHPVAVLGPVESEPVDAYQALIDAGTITPAKRRFTIEELPPRAAHSRSSDDILNALREERF